MTTTITMPALSPTMEEGNLAKWHVKVGDKIKPGDIIAEIETDKATMEVEAVDEGTVTKLLVEEGAQGVKVNAVIAELDGEAGGAAAKTDAPKKAPDKVAEKSGAASAASGSPPSRGTRNNEQAPAGDKQAVAVTASGPLPSAGKGDERVKASPLARRLAQQQGVDLLALKGSGPHGRIVKSDVLKAPKGAPAAGKTAPGAAGGITSLIEPALLDDRVYAPDTYELIPLDGVRKVTARRLTQSFMQVPHFPLTIDLEIDHLLSARARINEAGEKAGVKVSVNDMLIKACAMALMANPDANASYTDKGVAQHKSAHVSVAVAITGGLITPVVRDAQTKGLAQIAAEMKDLAARAREKKLKPQEYMGGTFSISNLGMMGIRQFASIINPPEGMILSVGAGEKRAVVKDDKVVVATMMTVTLTCDHRVVDGATGARWLASFKQFVETPEAMLL
ncbi:MAG: pyruvate dehydrogenase complex dihydrolipoamide acetyltransferase [Alphaproteobacteria bacterium]|jgi:pyruvate dehydrogenase E2 component (dihydrolipoamide acetyltransferase)|nr:MAG: pyruvate dehydrogenase complex dihydrolipoamide acetyltransferase [Alphaproteobacteria bacterium]